METKSSTGLVGVAIAVLVAVMMLGTILVPVIYDSTHTTVSVTNEGAGELRFAYYDEPTGYVQAVTYDDDLDKITIGTQTVTATDMITWASDVGSIIYSDGGFTLLYDNEGTMTAVDLGLGYSLSGHAYGGAGIAGLGMDTIEVTGCEWSYVPDADGVFGFFTDTGKTVKDFPTAAAGEFAGAYAYNDLNSLGMSTLAPTYSVSGGVFNQGDWELQSEEDLGIGEPYRESASTNYNAIVDPSTGTLVGDLYYTFSGTKATVVGISSALSSATSITIPDTVTSGGTTYDVTSIADGSSSSNVFGSMTALETVTFPANMTSIGSSAFRNCTSLALTSLPDGLTSIGSAAFRNCTSLALTSLPDGLTSIRSYAFAGCTSLALTSLPDGLTSIEDDAFENCTSLALTSLPDGLTSIGSNAFAGSSLALTSLPDGLTNIWNSVFLNCTSLALTSLPDGLTSIGISAFGGCTSLALTSLPDGLTSIGSNAFQSCTSLALTSLPDGLTSIGSYAFDGCTDLVNLVINGSPSIGYRAFYQCSDLVGVVFTGSPTIANDSFYSSGVAEVLNLGDTEITAGSYGLSADAEVDDAIRAIGYIAPVSFSTITENEGAAYDIMNLIPVMIVLAVLTTVVAVVIRRD